MQTKFLSTNLYLFFTFIIIHIREFVIINRKLIGIDIILISKKQNRSTTITFGYMKANIFYKKYND
jgi:hypothetical protein